MSVCRREKRPRCAFPTSLVRGQDARLARLGSTCLHPPFACLHPRQACAHVPALHQISRRVAGSLWGDLGEKLHSAKPLHQGNWVRTRWVQSRHLTWERGCHCPLSILTGDDHSLWQQKQKWFCLWILTFSPRCFKTVFRKLQAMEFRKPLQRPGSERCQRGSLLLDGTLGSWARARPQPLPSVHCSVISPLSASGASSSGAHLFTTHIEGHFQNWSLTLGVLQGVSLGRSQSQAHLQLE